jgi:hypothetical protein
VNAFFGICSCATIASAALAAAGFGGGATGSESERRTFLASTSSRKRTNTGARKAPSSVQLWKLTSAAILGSTQIVGPFNSGTSANGQVLRVNGSSRAFTCASVRVSKPEPTCDAYCSLPFSQ